MAKDPAFLFYPGDWMQGTMILNRHQKGCYMDLLIAQFNNGPLSLESIKTILGQDQASWTVLSSKFKQDSEGNYFNERLATEIEKRKQFAESRRQNGLKGGRPKALDKPIGYHLPNHTENRNEVKDDSCIEFSIEHCSFLALQDERFVRVNKTNEFELGEFNKDLEKSGIYNRNPAEYKRHFGKWKPKNPDKLKTSNVSTMAKAVSMLKNKAQ